MATRQRIIPILFLVAAVGGCAAMERQKIAAGGYKATGALADGVAQFWEVFPAWDLQHQQAIVDAGKAAKLPDAEIAVAADAYRDKRAKLILAMQELRRVVHVAAAGFETVEKGADTPAATIYKGLISAGEFALEAAKACGYDLWPLIGTLLGKAK